MKRYAIVHSEMGVFVGTAFDLCFFSMIDAAGQACAPALPSKEDADNYISIMAAQDSSKGFFFTVEVECEGEYADVLVLRQAGVREVFLEPMIDASFTQAVAEAYYRRPH